MTAKTPEATPLTPAGRRRRILTLALPIIGGMVSQNVLNLVDTAFVGSLGNEALAGVGLGGFLNFLCSAFILGLGAGVQAMAARRVGEGRRDQVAVPLNGGLLLAAGMAIPWSVALIFSADVFFPWVSADPAVVAEGVPYLQARLVAMTAMGMNYAFRGFWNATDRSKLYMRTLMTMHVINIFLNWVLIFGNLGAPALGATGAGVASAVATFAGTAQYFYLGLREGRDEGFLRAIPGRETVRTMLRLAGPAGLQQLFFAGGMTVFLVLIGHIGTAELAAAKVIIDLLLVGLLPGLGFGLAAASLVGQALGRGEVDDARRWGWDVVRISLVAVGIVGLPAVVAPELILSVFIKDPETLAMAATPMRIIASFIAFDAASMVLMNALIGSGDVKRVSIVSISMQWLLFLPVVWLVGPQLGFGLTAVFVANVVYRAIQGLIFANMWRGTGWTAVKI